MLKFVSTKGGCIAESFKWREDTVSSFNHFFFLYAYGVSIHWQIE